jgi:hypothetical protein
MYLNIPIATVASSNMLTQSMAIVRASRRSELAVIAINLANICDWPKYPNLYATMETIFTQANGFLSELYRGFKISLSASRSKFIVELMPPK